jgi:hypothetical protein
VEFTGLARCQSAATSGFVAGDVACASSSSDTII